VQEVADVSSSAARKSLIEGDVTRASTLLHPAVLVWCLQHGPWQPAAAFSTLSDISPPSLLPSAPSSASSSSPSWAHTPTATLKDVLAACPSPEVRDNASQYAERMRASGFDNVESILGYDDDMMREMREELEAKGVPTIDAVTIVSMLEAARNASLAGTSTTPPHPHAPPSPLSLTSTLETLKEHPLEARLQLSGFGFEVEDEDKLGGWVCVDDCTAAVLRVLIDGGTQEFTSVGDSGRQAYEVFRDPATNELQQRNCKTNVRVCHSPARNPRISSLPRPLLPSPLHYLPSPRPIHGALSSTVWPPRALDEMGRFALAAL
jgi:hypothetical protein